MPISLQVFENVSTTELTVGVLWCRCMYVGYAHTVLQTRLDVQKRTMIIVIENNAFLHILQGNLLKSSH
jgi:hypothetical protein